MKVVERREGVGSLEDLGQGLDPKKLSFYFSNETMPSPRFRLPAADNGEEVFFNNQELVNRFLGIPLPTQKSLLQNAREMMCQHGVTTLLISVQWTRNTTKTLQITAPTGVDFQLNFELH